uniref:Rho termination factor N-terminal domain-containing protein n=1 Tax=Nelumbo nucifera TaxID=4432 RepID=A0A822ZGE7_NELNU|nr:TPA_asm: hypothetical protein HUJ06_000735 [Nelumbo nucifera]
MQACGTTVTDNDDNVRLSLELREWKSKSQSEQIMAQVSALVPPLECNFAMFSQSEGKQKRPGIPPYHLSNPRYPGKKVRRTDQPIPSVAEMLNCVAHSGSKISLNRPSISQVKRSKCAIFPPRGEEEEPNANTGPLSVPGVNDPNSLTVNQLKKYAKHQGLKRYSKLSKASLIDYLRKMGYLG